MSLGLFQVEITVVSGTLAILVLSYPLVGYCLDYVSTFVSPEFPPISKFKCYFPTLIVLCLVSLDLQGFVTEQ